MAGSNGEKAGKFVDLVVKVATGILVFVTTQTLISVQGLKSDFARLEERVANVAEKANGISMLDARVRSIESNCFSAKDALKVLEEVAVIKARLPTSFPPPETKNELVRIDERIHAMEKAISEIQSKMK